MHKKESREQLLITTLNALGKVSVSEATKLLDISEATARRLFADMEKQGKLVRTYGGAQLPTTNISYNFDIRAKEHSKEKVAIGRFAASLVEENDTIYLDCGTTLNQMAIALGELVTQRKFKRLNIITNSIVNVQAIPAMEEIKVILLGGEYNSYRRDFSGPLTERYVAPFFFTKAFLGCDGCSEFTGFSSGNFSISSLNTTVMQHTSKSYILMDSGKFAHQGVLSYAPLSSVYAIVTEEYPQPSLRSAIKNAGVEILKADMQGSFPE